jgi:hypothetical protein
MIVITASVLWLIIFYLSSTSDPILSKPISTGIIVTKNISKQKAIAASTTL